MYGARIQLYLFKQTLGIVKPTLNNKIIHCTDVFGDLCINELCSRPKPVVYIILLAALHYLTVPLLTINQCNNT